MSWSYPSSCLNPDAAFDAVPYEVGGRPVEDGSHETIGGLKFEIVKRRFRGAQAMFGLSRNEHQIAGADPADSLRRFDRAVAFHDEVEVLAVLMQVVGRGRALGVAHDPGQHVVDLSQFLVDEEGALP